jgi:alkylation response protein AidB-like acyl-CoA dehydrogenase
MTDTLIAPTTATDPYGSPADEMHWLERARELAADFATRAPAHEDASELPVENLQILHDEGFDTALLPVEEGGGGMSLRTFGPVLAAIVEGCPPTACVWLMHVGAATSLITLGSDDMRPEWIEALRRGDRFANALSEPSSGNMFLIPMQPGVPVDGGWTLSGAKRFVSGCETADHFLVNASIDGMPAFFGIHRDDTLSFTPIWETMGMRATRSQLIGLDETFLPEAHMCRPPGPGDANPIGVGLPWLSLGVADAAMAALVDHAKGRVIPSTGAPLSHMQWVQFDVADAHVRLEAARLLASRCLWLGDQGSPETIGAAIEAKLLANQVAKEVADLGVRIGGASGYLATSPIQRHFRNAQAGWLMAYSVEVCRDWVGKRVLDVVEGGAGGYG